MIDLHFRDAENDLENELLQVTQRRFEMLKTAGDLLGKDPLSLRGKSTLRLADSARKDQTKICKQLIALRKVMKNAH